MPWNTNRTAVGDSRCPGCFDPDCECQDEAPGQERPDPFPTTPKEQKEWVAKQATPEQIQAMLEAGVPEEIALHTDRAGADKILADVNTRIDGATGTVRVEGDELVIYRTLNQQKLFKLTPEQRFDRATTRVEYRVPTFAQAGYVWFIPTDQPDTGRARKIGKIGRDPSVVVVKVATARQVEDFVETTGLDGAVYVGRGHRYETFQEWAEVREIDQPRGFRWLNRQIERQTKETEVRVRFENRKEDK